jgi:hypothetical protein
MSDESSGSGGSNPESADVHTDPRAMESSDVTRRMIEGFPAVPPHPLVWRRITSELRSDSEPPRRNRSFLLFGIAAAVVLIAGVVGLLNTDVSFGWRQTSNEPVAIRELSDPNTGAVALTVHSRPDGSSIAVSAETLPALDDSSTYQLWAVVGAEIVSVGVLGPSIDSAPVRLEGETTTLALTIEATGGVAVSSATPVAVWTASG